MAERRGLRGAGVYTARVAGVMRRGQIGCERRDRGGDARERGGRETEGREEGRGFVVVNGESGGAGRVAKWVKRKG